MVIFLYCGVQTILISTYRITANMFTTIFFEGVECRKIHKISAIILLLYKENSNNCLTKVAGTIQGQKLITIQGRKLIAEIQ